MKKYLAFLGSGMFFVVCISLYLMLESTYSENNELGNNLKSNNLNSIEFKIKKIEQDLKYNHRMVNSIKDTFKDIIGGDEHGIEKLNSLLNKYDKYNHSKEVQEAINFHENNKQRCMHSRDSSSKKTDVSMSEILKALPFDNPDGGAWKQGWPINYNVDDFKKQKLKVFVVPHSHNDPGWIKTFERYYQEQTKFILDNMVTKLEEHSHMKFIYAEMSFFSLWWSELGASQREKVKHLIDSGRLEIATGGWVMTDEANAHYAAMLDQLVEGNDWLQENLGVHPKSGWAIDPFGQSPTMAYILKKSGFDNMLIQRVHYTVKKYLAKKKSLEFSWRQHWDFAGRNDMFCHMMPFYSYDVPHTCGPDPKICCQFDFKRLPGGRISCPWRVAPQEITDSNVQARAEMLLDQYRKKAQLYQNNVVLAPLGDDFRYDQTIEWDQQYGNYQKLFEYMNSRDDWYVEAKFGTLSDYFEAVRERAGSDLASYPVISGDFFTYSDRDDHYWSGYYTSRPFYKRLDRIMEAHLRSSEIIFTLAAATARKAGISTFPDMSLYKKIVQARRNLGLYQHHDGITGTSKDAVVVDYGRRLAGSIADMKVVAMNSIHLLMNPKNVNFNYVTDYYDVDEIRKNFDQLAEKTLVQVHGAPKSVVVYNSLAQERRTVVSLIITSPNVVVFDPSGSPIQSQVSPVWKSHEEIADDVFALDFVVNIKGLSLNIYTIKTDHNNPLHSIASIDLYNYDRNIEHKVFKTTLKNADRIELNQQDMTVWIDPATGTLSNVIHMKKEHPCSIKFLTYGTTHKPDKSGAYLFMPDGEAKPMVYSRPHIRVVNGGLKSEIKSSLPYVEHSLSILKSHGLEDRALHIKNIVNIKSEFNKELVMRVQSEIKNGNQWFSDINGFQIIERNTLKQIPLQGNFYPMPTMAFLQDNHTRMTLLNGQSLGVASLHPGTIEVILDRRLNQDDNRGLQQGVTDNVLTENLFTLFFEPVSKSESKHSVGSYPSQMAHALSMQLIHSLNLVIIKNTDVIQSKNQELLKASLSCDVHLLNLRSKLVERSDKKLQASVFLHKLTSDCNIADFCDGLGSVDVDMFSGLSFEHLHRVSLNLLHSLASVNTTKVKLDEMEIEAFKGYL